jgi:hypothetical protein
MNVTFGLIDDAAVAPSKDRGARRAEIGRRALEEVARWKEGALGVPAVTASPRGLS